MTVEMWTDYRIFKAAGLLHEWRNKWAAYLPEPEYASEQKTAGETGHFVALCLVMQTVEGFGGQWERMWSIYLYEKI